jgi:patatin-like phospholipase/acyl hydrolase
MESFMSDSVVGSGSKKFQILSLNGGGIKGVFSVKVLHELEERFCQKGESLTDHFDMICGTSIGGILALGLAHGLRPIDLLEHLKTKGPEIFPPRPSAFNHVKRLLSPLYKPDPLKDLLKEIFGETKIKDLKVPLIIPAINTTTGSPKAFKTKFLSEFVQDQKYKLVDVALATSAAPTYFPSFSHNGNTYLDGGLWANNPSLIGVVEAMEMGANIKNIRVLNISTTSSNTDCLKFKLPLLPLKISFSNLGKIPWASKILTLMMQANSHSTTNMYLRQMLSSGNLACIDEQLNAGHAELDDINYEEFYTRGKSVAEQAKNGINHFFKHLATKYTPNIEAMTDEYSK